MECWLHLFAFFLVERLVVHWLGSERSMFDCRRLSFGDHAIVGGGELGNGFALAWELLIGSRGGHFINYNYMGSTR